MAGAGGGGVRTVEMYFLTVLETRCPRSSCQQVRCLLRLLSDCGWLCHHTVFFLCTCIPGVSLYVQIPSSHDDTSQIGLKPPQQPHFKVITSLNGLSKYNHILRYQGLRFHHKNFEGTQFNSQHEQKIKNKKFIKNRWK